jgi:hypothetical protein
VPSAANGLTPDFTIQRDPRANGGCNFVENPALDARELQPQWLPSPSSVVRLIDLDEDDRDTRFSLWRIPGRKTLLHDGRQLHLTSEIGSSRLRLLAQHGSLRGRFLRLRSARWRGCAQRLGGERSCEGALINPSVAVWEAATRRPTHMGLLRMRALQALDGALSGASQREIAVALFGADVVARNWHADSELRARIRYLIRRASALMNGGYCRLLHGRS